MTDGQNEDPGSISLDQLLQRLEELKDPDRPVRMVGIAISGDADLGALRQMAAGDRRRGLPRGRARGRAGGVRPGGAVAVTPQASSSTTWPATQAGLSWPSISIVCSTTSCLPAARSVTSPKRDVRPQPAADAAPGWGSAPCSGRS